MKKKVNAVWMFFCLCALVFVGVFGSIYSVKKTQSAWLSGYSATPVIVIDPGHGGIDSGAVGHSGETEKEINLSIAKKLQVLLEHFGFSTVMTRESDLSIHNSDAKTIKQQKTSDLKNRLKILEDTPYSILISIHQNTYSSSSSWGTQVFYGGNCPESEELAKMLQNTIVSFLQPENYREVKKAGKNLYILHKATKPSVMIECGFLTNAQDAQHLQQDAYQEQLAFAVCVSLLNCLAE